MTLVTEPRFSDRIGFFGNFLRRGNIYNRQLFYAHKFNVQLMHRLTVERAIGGVRLPYWLT